MSLPPTSHTLLARLRGREPGSAERFVSYYVPLLTRYASRCGAGGEAGRIAEDACGNAFLHLDQFCPEGGPGRFRRWLGGIVRNLVRDLFRDRARHAASSDGLSGVAAPPEAGEIDEAEHREALIRYARDVVLRECGQRDREIFNRRLRGDESKDIAAELGITPGAEQIAYHRILARLRAEMAGLDG